MPINHCPHCGEAERLHFTQDPRGPVLWCQSCFRVTVGDADPVYCPHFGSAGCARAEAEDIDDRTPCLVCPRQGAGP